MNFKIGDMVRTRANERMPWTYYVVTGTNVPVTMIRWSTLDKDENGKTILKKLDDEVEQQLMLTSTNLCPIMGRTIGLPMDKVESIFNNINWQKIT